MPLTAYPKTDLKIKDEKKPPIRGFVDFERCRKFEYNDCTFKPKK